MQEKDLILLAKGLLNDILYAEDGNPYMFYAAIEFIFTKFYNYNFFILNFKVDFLHNLDLEIETTKIKPDNYSFENIASFLTEIHIGLSSVKKIITGFTLKHNEFPSIRITNINEE